MREIVVKVGVSSDEEERALKVFLDTAPEARGRMLLEAMMGLNKEDLWASLQEWKVNCAGGITEERSNYEV